MAVICILTSSLTCTPLNKSLAIQNMDFQTDMISSVNHKQIHPEFAVIGKSGAGIWIV